MNKLFLSLTFVLQLSFSVAQASGPDAAQDRGQVSDCEGLDENACVIFNETNRIRKKYRLPQLEICERCTDMAQDHSEDMKKKSYFAHDRPRRRDRRAESFSERAERFGLGRGAGENIAWGTDGSKAMEMWMKSKPHRANILNRKFRYIGVGFYEEFATQVFWVGPRDETQN